MKDPAEPDPIVVSTAFSDKSPILCCWVSSRKEAILDLRSVEISSKMRSGTAHWTTNMF